MTPRASHTFDSARGLTTRFLTQVNLPLVFRGRVLDKAYRLDLLVNDSVIVEIKAVDRLTSTHVGQVELSSRAAPSAFW